MTKPRINTVYLLRARTGHRRFAISKSRPICRVTYKSTHKENFNLQLFSQSLLAAALASGAITPGRVSYFEFALRRNSSILSHRWCAMSTWLSFCLQRNLRHDPRIVPDMAMAIDCQTYRCGHWTRHGGWKTDRSRWFEPSCVGIATFCSVFCIPATVTFEIEKIPPLRAIPCRVPAPHTREDRPLFGKFRVPTRVITRRYLPRFVANVFQNPQLRKKNNA